MNFGEFYDVVRQGSSGDDDPIVFLYNDFRECQTSPDRRYRFGYYLEKHALLRSRSRVVLCIAASDDARAVFLTKGSLLGYLDSMKTQIDPNCQIVLKIDGTECLHSEMWARVDSSEQNCFVLSDGGSHLYTDGNPYDDLGRWMTDRGVG